MSERNTNRPLESVRKWDPTAYSTSLANGEIIAAPCAEYSRIAGPKGTSRPRLALSTFDFRLLLMMGLRGENEQRNCAGGAWIVTTREACTLAQGSPRGAWNRPSRFPSFRFLVSSFWFSGFLRSAFCRLNLLPIRLLDSSIARRLLPALLKRRPNSQHMEAKFYLALAFAGCELRVSKISDRTRPFI